MPQLRFLQTFAALALAAVVLTVVALPVGARGGARAGRRVLRAGAILLAAGLAGSVAWGVASGEWTVFWQELGLDAVVQIGAFVLIVYSTAHNFVSRYLDDKAASERARGAADA
ncbi:MAG: hypothetical protein QMD96_05985 [Anaerosomatales bacterium]|nr:hypothetical protein [Anaerosomatales bacterium]